MGSVDWDRRLFDSLIPLLPPVRKSPRMAG
jgi:hypothetical protein